MTNNNHNHEFDHDVPRPSVSLGTMTFTLDLDTGGFNIGLSNDSTGQLTTPQEATGLFSMTAMKQFCEELQRRSKRVIIT
jgi:hypothetical protein